MRVRAGATVAAAALALASCGGGSGTTGAGSPPPPTGAPAAIADDFDRAAADGWGAADGDTWVTTLTAGRSLDLAVEDGRAIARAPEGVNKANFLIGPDHAGAARAAATFTVDMQPERGTQSHWQVLVRASAPRTYYGMRLTPAPGADAVLDIFRAVDGTFEPLAERPAGFRAETGGAYRIQGRVETDGTTVRLDARAWPAGEPEPAQWELRVEDASGDRLLSGRVGVRLSSYAGPSTMTVDEFRASFGA